jgi:hypothetical protein
MSKSKQSIDAQADAATRALAELFSDPKLRSRHYHRYVLVRQESGELVFKQDALDLAVQQAIARAFGEPKPRRRSRKIRMKA